MKRAVVLGGGGSKGSYQIGAWKALRELNIEYQIITGTSIGSCNGALMVQDDYAKALELWQSIDIDKVVINGLNLRTDFNYYMEHSDKLVSFFKSYTNNKGMDITPFQNLLEHYISEERFFNAPIDYGLVSVKFPAMQPVCKHKDSIPKGRLKDWIMASCACFPAFPICEIDGEGYIDGGYYDNLPISLAFELGAEEVIAIALNPKPHHYTHHPLVRCIQPRERLGGMLDFDKDMILANIQLGYLDTMKSFQKLLGRDYSFYLDDISVYVSALKQALAHILHNELIQREERGFEIFNKFIGTKTPINDRILELLDFANDKEITLTLLESQMHLHHYSELNVYSFHTLLPELAQKSKKFLYTQGRDVDSLMTEDMDTQELLALLFIHSYMLYEEKRS